MDNEEKARIYDECLRESDALQRKISRLKSEYVGNIPADKQKEIDGYNNKIRELNKKVESLFNI